MPKLETKVIVESKDELKTKRKKKVTKSEIVQPKLKKVIPKQETLSSLKEKCKSLQLKMTGSRTNLSNRIKKSAFFSRIQKNEEAWVDENKKLIAKREQKFVPSEYGGDLFQSMFTDEDRSFFLFDRSKEKITKKIYKGHSICDLNQKDIGFLKILNLPYEIPIVLKGEIIAQRNKSQEDDDFDFFSDEEED